jgi:hypothetical protein
VTGPVAPEVRAALAFTEITEIVAASSGFVATWKSVLNPTPVPALAEVMLAVKVRGVSTTAVVGDVIVVVRSGHNIFTVPDTAGEETADVPPAFVAVMV